MTGPSQWTTPPPPPTDDSVARAARQRRGIIGASVGLGIFLIATALGLILGTIDSGATGEAALGRSLILLMVEVFVAPVTVIVGIVLAAVERTRPWGVGFLIGSAVGILVTAGVCFGQLAISSPGA